MLKRPTTIRIAAPRFAGEKVRARDALSVACGLVPRSRFIGCLRRQHDVEGQIGLAETLERRRDLLILESYLKRRSIERGRLAGRTRSLRALGGVDQVGNAVPVQPCGHEVVRDD